MNHNRKALSERYLSVMSELLGWPCEADEEGNLRFQFEDSTFFIDNHAPQDPEYLRLHMGLALDEATLAQDLDPLAAAATLRTKGAKVLVLDGFVVSSVELIVAPPDCLPLPQLLAGVLPRAARMARQGMASFATALTLAGIEAVTEASLAE